MITIFVKSAGEFCGTLFLIVRLAFVLFGVIVKNIGSFLASSIDTIVFSIRLAAAELRNHLKAQKRVEAELLEWKAQRRERIDRLTHPEKYRGKE